MGWEQEAFGVSEIPKSWTEEAFGPAKEFNPTDYSKHTDLVTPKGYVVPGAALDKQEEVESAHKSSAVSKKKAVGLMQMTPIAAKDIGVDYSRLSEPEYGRNAGRAFMAKLVDTYNGDMEKALAAYHSGMGNVKKGLDKLGPEGRDYLHKLSEFIKPLKKVPFSSTAKASTLKEGLNK